MINTDKRLNKNLEDYFNRPIKYSQLITQGKYGDKINPFIFVVFSDNLEKDVICLDYKVYKRHYIINEL